VTSTIPVQMEQFLTLALGVVFVTQFLKWLAAKLNLVPLIHGKGAVVVSAVASALLTFLAYAAGWVPLALPSCAANLPYECANDWLVVIGGVMVLANLLYAVVYTRVFETAPPLTKHG